MKSQYTFSTKTEEETIEVGKTIGKISRPGTVIALIGDLGTGKTVLTKGIAKGMGIREEPNSPTFVILNIYESDKILYHLDLYRLSHPDELTDIGFDEIINSEGVAVIEWADKIKDILPSSTITVEIKHGEIKNNTLSTSRIITIKGDKEWVLLFKNMVEQVLPT